MTDVVRRMVDVAKSFDTFDIESALRDPDLGRRLFGYAYTFARPNPSQLETLVESVTRLERKPFGQYWGLQALGRVLPLASLIPDAQCDHRWRPSGSESNPGLIETTRSRNFCGLSTGTRDCGAWRTGPRLRSVGGGWRSRRATPLLQVRWLHAPGTITTYSPAPQESSGRIGARSVARPVLALSRLSRGVRGYQSTRGSPTPKQVVLAVHEFGPNARRAEGAARSRSQASTSRL